MKGIIKLFFLSFFLFSSCGEKRENKNAVRKITKWENGNIRTEGYYVNDSIKEGLFKNYYRSGKLEAEVNYHNNKINGLVIKYFENGKKEYVIPYVDGVPSRAGEVYYESGAIKWYQLYDRDGKNRFQIDFLEDGKIKSVKGLPVVDTTFNKRNFSVGDTLKISFVVAVPKNSKVQFLIYDDFVTKQNGRDLEVNEKEGTVKYEKVLGKKGIMKWGGLYTIKLDNGENIKYDNQAELIVK